jgi:hypothetical protein
MQNWLYICYIYLYTSNNLLNGHGVNFVRRTEMHITQPLVPDPSFDEVVIDIEYLIIHIFHQIFINFLAEFIRKRIHSEVHNHIHSLYTSVNREFSPCGDRRKE